MDFEKLIMAQKLTDKMAINNKNASIDEFHLLLGRLLTGQDTLKSFRVIKNKLFIKTME